MSSESPVAPPTVRRGVLEKQFSPWASSTISQLFDRVATLHSDDPFVVTDSTTYTYGQIRDWSLQIAAGLVELGVQSGEHVALVMANYPEFIAAKFAIARVGAVCVPINFLLRERELSYVLGQSDSVALITMDRFRDIDYVGCLGSMMPGWEERNLIGIAGGAQFPKLRDVVVFSPEGRPQLCRTLKDLGELATPGTLREVSNRELTAQADSFCDILYTSGTTGLSKGVLLTHDMLVRTGYASAYSRALAEGHRMVYSMPMYHVFGYIECLLAATFVGGVVVPQPTFDPHAMLQAVVDHQVNEIVCIPTMTFALIAAARETSYDFSSMRIMYSSGGPQPPSIWDEIYDVFGSVEGAAGYGQTETTAAMTSCLPELSDDYLRRTNGTLRPAGIAGDPALGGVLAVYRAIDTATGSEVSAGAIGELVVRGPAVTSGYYNKPEETSAAIDSDGWLHTGDLGVIDAEGYITLVGRVKESYRCGGEMVMPKEVETLLNEQAGVSQSHVVGIPHPKMGEVGCAFVVRDESVAAGSITDTGLVEVCRVNLARFKVPAYVLFIGVDELPLTVTGRVQKFKLVQIAMSLLSL
jgi:fatty-acyl-CoA synthase